MRIELFRSWREVAVFTLFALVLLGFTLFIEYKNYKEFIRFDTAIVEATPILYYTKTKNDRSYQVLKLQTNDGLTFYTTKKKPIRSLDGKLLKLKVYINEISFKEYLSQFYMNSKVLAVTQDKSRRAVVDALIADAHKNKSIGQIYQALYTNKSVSKEMQTAFSNLGVSHIVAISGFHLSILSALVYFLFRPLYGFFQSRYFPYRNANIDLFFVVMAVLFAYTAFLGYPPSLVRSLGMFVVGFVLYDRGVEVFSMQTLFVAVVLLVALFPKVAFSLGFWLSALGVFYIFLFLIHFSRWRTVWIVLGLAVFVYLFMLPVSLFLFGNFSIYHPYSIPLALLFTPFYPLSIVLHFIGYGDFFDYFLLWLMELGRGGVKVEFAWYFFLSHLLLSLVAIKSKIAMYALILASGAIFIYALALSLAP